MTWATIRQAAAETALATFGVAGGYRSPAGVHSAGTVRIQDEFIDAGDQGGSLAKVPVAKALISELGKLAPGGIITTDDGDYRVVEKPFHDDGITTKARVAKIR